MKRRKFLLLSLAAAGAASLPIAGCSSVGPDMLSKLCDEKTMLEIGRDYLQKHPAESNRHTLKELTKTTDIRTEFRNGNIVVIKGWVLSLTEARQCALLTL